jgi:hypothetical protein
LAKIIELKNLKKHSNADRLQTVDVDFKTVITGMNAKNGDIYVYFPLECKINEDFLSFTNSFRDKTKNADPEQVGFFEDNCRVKAMRLRGEKSMGYIVPIAELEAFTGETGLVRYVGEEFDTIGNVKILEKYVVNKKEDTPKQGKKPKTNRLVEGQVHLHTDTEQLRKNAHKIKPNDYIAISYKTHGTSWWVSNVMVKRPLSLVEKILKYLKVNINETEYDYVYGSRKVVKNFYGYDLWEHIKEEVRDSIPKNFTLYGEAIGYTKDGGFIQKGYDYGVTKGEFKLEVYRITVTNPDGLVTELSTPEIREFCKKTGLTASHQFFYGRAIDWLQGQGVQDKDWTDTEWQETFIKTLEEVYNEKDCFMCKNAVPEEGVVVRKEGLFGFEAFKLKSFRFLEWESKDLDSGEGDIESEN